MSISQIDFLFCWRHANAGQESSAAGAGQGPGQARGGRVAPGGRSDHGVPAAVSPRLGHRGREGPRAGPPALRPTRSMRPVPGTGLEPWPGGRPPEDGRGCRVPSRAAEPERGSLTCTDTLVGRPRGWQLPPRRSRGRGIGPTSWRPAPHARTTGRLRVTGEGDREARPRDVPAGSDPRGGPREA